MATSDQPGAGSSQSAGPQRPVPAARSEAGRGAAGAHLWLTEVTGSRVVDRSGETLGRVEDVIVRFGAGDYPPVTGLVARLAGRQVFLPRDRVGEISRGQVRLQGETLSLLRFERRQGEVLLRRDVLGRRMINVEDGTLISAGDIQLAQVRGAWRIVGVDPGRGGGFARLLRLPHRPHHNGRIVDWSQVEPFVRHVPASRLLMPLRRLRRLHPAEIADIVEQASHEEGEEIISAVHADPELEADVFEELNTEHQVEFLRSRSDADAAAVLAEMGSDDAADLITELDQERRAPILAQLPPAKQAKVRALLSYSPESAGGLMSPDYVAVPVAATVAEALAAVRSADLSPQVLTDVFLVEAEGRLVGAAPLVSLIQASETDGLSDLVQRGDTALELDDDLPEVARLMTDFNLSVAPVVDDERRLVGVISVDDVLEAILPDSWRRRAEADHD
ncbi:MAG TPA: CBS domain-containing protein [Candidatus Binatia bacterium]|nr:CBS domain-containing protein [Candidatus Binatia bacterium]